MRSPSYFAYGLILIQTFNFAVGNPSASSETPTHSVTARDSVIANDAPLHDQDMTTDPWFADAEKLFLAKKRIAEDTEKISKNPNDPAAYIDRADAYLRLRKSNESIEDSTKAIELKPDTPSRLSSAYCNRGEGQLQLKRYDEGLKDLLKAISLDDENAEAIYFRGMARESLGQLEMAKKDYLVARDFGFAPKGVKVDYSSYMAELQRTIKKNWLPPKGGKSRKTVVYFRLLRNGLIENIRIDNDSGSPESNEAALAAVRSSAPFQALPKGSPKGVEVSFNFDYNVNTNGPPAQGRDEEMARIDAEAKERVLAAEKAGDDSVLFNALIAQADAYRDRRSLTFAEQVYKRAQTLIEKRGNKVIEESRVVARLAMIESLRNKNKEAEVLYNQSLEIAFQLGKRRTDPDVEEILRDYAKLLYKDSRYDDVKKVYDRFKAQ
jgi:TonB family protein